VSFHQILINSDSFLSFQEYHQFVTVGQTHSLQTHNKFYALKRRKLEEAKQNEELFSAHLNEHPLPIASILEEENSQSPLDSTSSQNPIISTFNTFIDPAVIQDINEVYEFGTARPDLNKKGSRFEWTAKEISHLQHFITQVEPTLSESERKNKYSTCLNYLKRADSNIQQDFHPFHCENSGRIKTGYEVAIKKLGY